MSRIGKKIILLSPGANFSLDQNKAAISGPLGEIVLTVPEGLEIKKEENKISIVNHSEEEKTAMMHGTFRQTLFNAIQGVTQGWKKELEVKGTGFKAQLEAENLILNVGFCHPVKVPPPDKIKYEVKENKITIIGPDKVKVGLLADKIRKIYPPDSYKGKGIRYFGEKIVLKPGKAAKVGAVGGVGGGVK